MSLQVWCVQSGGCINKPIVPWAVGNGSSAKLCSDEKWAAKWDCCPCTLAFLGRLSLFIMSMFL